MNRMRSFQNQQLLLIIAANVLTWLPNAWGKIEIPTCPDNSERVFMPDPTKPVWAACKDATGLYQGIIIQFSGQVEIIRIAAVKNSLREGREIRLGAPGTLEERTFKKGHLEGRSFIFKSPTTLGRVFPPKASLQDWLNFSVPPSDSILKPWLKSEPTSTLEFTGGRLTRLQFETTDYKFKISKDQRIYSLNHPDMTDHFFVDPEPLWLLNAADLQADLKPGFGSCKKYAGPISRFGRNYDHMLFKREVNEKKFSQNREEARLRFIKFCVPEDILSHLGTLECPPQLPTNFSASHCLLPLSDQLRIPYQPKYFVFEFTMGHSPEEIHEVFEKSGLPKFVSDFNSVEEVLTLSPKVSIQIKRTGDGILFRPLEIDKLGHIIKKQIGLGPGSIDWWEWHPIPGY